MTSIGAAAWLILILTYAGVAIGRFPGLRLDRAGIALLGEAAMIVLGAAWLEEMGRDITSLGSLVFLGFVSLAAVGYLLTAGR